MAEITTIARPYAKAAFEFARDAQALDSWATSLETLAAISQNDKVSDQLVSPKLTAEQKAHMLFEICGDAIDDKVKSLVSLLADNQRLLLLSTIAEQFKNLMAQQQKFADVHLLSAFTIDGDTEKTLAEKLCNTLKSDVSISTTIDESLIGGVVIRAGDTVIDSSVKGRLAKLAESLGV